MSFAFASLLALGPLDWGVATVTSVAILASVALALNVQWGYAGMLNLGVGAFFMAGAYVSALLTLDAPRPPSDYVGGLGVPVLLGWAGAMLAGALLAYAVGAAARGLRGEIVAAVTLTLAFALRGMADGIEGFVNRGRGLEGIPSLFGVDGDSHRWAQLVLALVLVGATYALVRAATASPWGRVLRGLRDDEGGTRALAKDADGFRLQAFALGGALMALAGAVWAQREGSISPVAFDDVFGTFLIWAMVLAGGSGNHRGAVLGSALVGTLWLAAPEVAARLPETAVPQVAPVREFALGLAIVLVVLVRPQGVLPEESRISRYLPSHGPPEPDGGRLRRWLRGARS